MNMTTKKINDLLKAAKQEGKYTYAEILGAKAQRIIAAKTRKGKPNVLFLNTGYWMPYNEGDTCYNG